MKFSPRPSPREIRSAFAVTALGGYLFSFDLPLLRLSFADQWTMVFARGIFFFIAIAGAWFITSRWDDERPQFIAGGAGLLVALSSTIGNISYIGAVVHTNAANVVFIIALTPVLSAAISRVVLGERVHPFTWAATLLAFGGVGIIAWDGISSGHTVGNALAFISALCSAFTFVVIRATGKKVATSLAVGNLAAAMVALAVFGVSPAALLAPGALDLPAWVWIALNGLVAIPLATVMLASGPRVLPTADVSMFFMLETVLTPVWIWLLFRETPTPGVLLGGTVVIATLLVHSFWRLRTSVGNPWGRFAATTES